MTAEIVPGGFVRTTPSSVAQYALEPVVALIGVPLVRNVVGTNLAPGAATKRYPLLPEPAGVPLLARLASSKQAVPVPGVQAAARAPPRVTIAAG